MRGPNNIESSHRFVAARSTERRPIVGSLRNGSSRLERGRKKISAFGSNFVEERDIPSPELQMTDRESRSVDLSRAGCAHFCQELCIERRLPNDFHVMASMETTNVEYNFAAVRC